MPGRWSGLSVDSWLHTYYTKYILLSVVKMLVNTSKTEPPTPRTVDNDAGDGGVWTFLWWRIVEPQLSVGDWGPRAEHLPPGHPPVLAPRRPAPALEPVWGEELAGQLTPLHPPHPPPVSQSIICCCQFAWLSVFYYFLAVKILSNDYLGELIIS